MSLPTTAFSRGLAVAVLCLLSACASHPPVPDWQVNAKGAMDRATAAYLAGNNRVAVAEMAKARQELARTARPGLLAHAELLQCASQVASLVWGPCAGFEPLRPDATTAQVAYADYLAGQRLSAQAVSLLPTAQQAPALRPKDAGSDAGSLLLAIDDPLARLVAAAVMLQTGQGSPAVVALAVETASAQGWQRPLAAWLTVQRELAEQAGQPDEAARIARRLTLLSAP